MVVTKGKVSDGSRSLEDFEQTANLLTVVQTCGFQRPSVMDFFDRRSRYANEQALMAASGHLPEPPSLIPSLHT
ncbi:hypothetical protein [Moorena sp. SIO3I6]|uniref:hypothetical protein n=1 Tax=Moorena sp. SIO3I6 TaxID=2607831 RepID=UPI0013F8526A|nr:hypothetical protein [Moorena sp. SIO3I6]NEP22813.1 hypothetical protein [Moorena sp. SIO3I6]